MNWPTSFACFSLARTKLINYQCVGLTLLNCFPTFLLRKKEPEQAKQPYLFYARENKNYMLCKARSMINISTWSENGLPQSSRPKNCPTDIVRPHAAPLMIDRPVDHFQSGLALIAPCVISSTGVFFLSKLKQMSIHYQSNFQFQFPMLSLFTRIYKLIFFC